MSDSPGPAHRGGPHISVVLGCVAVHNGQHLVRRDDGWMLVAPTVVVVDDHPDFRAAARDLLEADGFTVIGEAADGHAGLALVDELGPDVVLLDIRLPGLDGFEVAAALAARRNRPAVVLVSSRDAAVYGRRIAQAPCCGFVAKNELTGAAVRQLLGP